MTSQKEVDTCKSSRQSITSCTIQNLRTEISKFESMLHKSNQKQNNLLSIVNNLRQTRLTNQNEHVRSFIAIDSINARNIIKQLDLQLTSGNQSDACYSFIDKSLTVEVKKPTLSPYFHEESDAEDDECCSEAISTMTNSTCTDDFSIQQQASSFNCSSPCMYNNLLDRIQRLEQYLTKPCRHCQQPLKNSITTSLSNYNNNAQTDSKDLLTKSFQIPSSKEFPSGLNNNLKQPVIMQGHLNNQPITLLNTSAVELITTLKQLRSKRNSLNKSHKNVLELLSTRDNQLVEINSILNEYYEQLQAIEHLKNVDDIIQDQNWDEMYKLISHIRSRSLFMSKLTSPKELNINENIKRLYGILNTSSSSVPSEVPPKSNVNESVGKEQKRTKKETKLMNKDRKKKDVPK